MITNLVLFGASGDLAGRFLLPALAALRATGRLQDEFTIVGTARQPWDDDDFREHAADRLAEHAADVPAEHRGALVRSLRYRPADVGDAHDVASVVSLAGEGPVAVYLALPPGLFAGAIAALADARLPAGSRVALEKPFGESLADAVELNELLARTVPGERAVFRVDHVLGMATVQNLLALRRHDSILAAVWDCEHIEQIEVRWEEDLGLEDRAGYYDGVGALKDVLQNHMLQILCLLTMEPPAGPDERELRDSNGAGRIAGHAVPAYVDEEGVDGERCTETFAEVALEVDIPRWHGTSFLLRTGKALAARHKEVVVRFRTAGTDGVPDCLRIGIDGPRDVALRLSGAAPMSLTGPAPASDLPPYGHVLLDLLSGGSTLSVRGGLVPLEEYPAGSEGPGHAPGRP
jgi:glucose-6-phosphate 1-dehydrogenase